MPPADVPLRKNPLKLNSLQLRTLVIAQVLAREGEGASPGPEEGEVTLRSLPDAHGDHFHIGPYTVPGRAASGLFNGAVWKALSRKGLARADAGRVPPVTLTAVGLAYDTGLADAFEAGDHEGHD